MSSVVNRIIFFNVSHQFYGKRFIMLFFNVRFAQKSLETLQLTSGSVEIPFVEIEMLYRQNVSS